MIKMNLSNLNKLYENNKKLDEIFLEKYKNTDNLFEKNCLELIVEIGEFLNETKIFKYWSCRIPNKTKMLDEYADIITMIFTFYGQLNLKIESSSFQVAKKDLIKLFNELYILATKLMTDFNEKLIRKIFDYTIAIGQAFNFSEEEIFKAIELKQNIIQNRLNSRY